MDKFIHLHNHTHYSLLDAVCTVDALVKSAVADHQKALAITDHGVMFGVIEFIRKCQEAGIKPIVGFEAYMANGSRFEMDAGKKTSKKRNYFHLILLAKNEQGYKNLIKLTSLAHKEGFYYKPRIDKELLEKYKEGLICLSGCIVGVVNYHLTQGEYENAVKTAKYYKELFGDDFYLEIQNHYLPEDEIILREIPKIAKELDIKIVATNDVHYIAAEHALAHNVLQYIKDSTKVDPQKIDIYKLRYRSPELYFKTQKQMIELFKDFPDAIKNTLEIEEKCTFNFEPKIYLPTYVLPDNAINKSCEEYLRELAEKGLKEKFEVITDEIRERFNFELEVINRMNFASYFLIVHDFINAAKELGIRVGPGRGSVVGSLISYCLGITNVNPLEFNLLFERFLNPDRISMPDIDIDFCDEKRNKIIEYVQKKYGKNCVAQIITFNKLSSRAVLKDVGRVLGINHQEINRFTAQIPTELGRVKPLKEALELPALKELKNSNDKKIKQLIEYSLLLEGCYRNRSIHAAGIVIAPGNVDDFVPVIYLQNQKETQVTEISTQYTMSDLEYAGLLKMDFLGLRTLSIIDHTLEMIKENYGIDIDIDKIDFNDEKTFQLISEGKTLGVFQFESSGMQEYLKQLKPNSLEELSAMNALYRPGPMESIPEFIDRKHGRKPITYLHPLMEKALKNTYGIIVYQEQVQQIGRDIGGLTLAQADTLRRAMGKKNQKVMDKMYPIYIEGAKAKGISENIANEIWELIQKFANYGFNKSHAVAYSYLAYQTAWLKAHYTAEFLSANMTAEKNDLEKISELINEAKSFGIEVLPPDINESQAHFVAKNNKIYFGLEAIKNVGTNAVKCIIKARGDKPFTSFFDFASRIDPKVVNRRVFESLIYAGAFDSISNGKRSALFFAIDDALNYAHSFQKKADNLSALFDDTQVNIKVPDLPDVEEWNSSYKLEKEKEVLKLYLSGNPLELYLPYIKALSEYRFNKVAEASPKQNVRVAGVIKSINTTLDKENRQMAFITATDLETQAELVLFASKYSLYQHLLDIDKLLIFVGKPKVKDNKITFTIEEIISLEDAVRQYVFGITFYIDADTTPVEYIDEIVKLCVDPEARTSFKFYIKQKSKNRFKEYIAENVNFNVNVKNINKLIELFGYQNINLMIR